MVLLSALLVALSLSMDNLAVTVAAGCAARGRIPVREELTAGLAFALAHLLMFSGGWGLGTGVGHFVKQYAPWVACGILVCIGIHMVWSAWKESDHPHAVPRLHGKTLLWLALATSIDAWLVGMGLAFTNAPFTLTVLSMTVLVFITSWVGFYFGTWLGEKFGRRMEILGGITLVGLGAKLLLEGLGIW